MQFCGADRLCFSAIKPLSERNLKDASAKRNETSEANSLLAPENTSRLGDQSEYILKCSPYHDPVYRTKEMLSASFSHVQEPFQLYTGTNEQDLRNSLSTISTAFTDYSSLKFKECRAVSAVTGRSVHSSSTMSSDLMDKLSQALSPGDKTIVSTVPELDYIWQYEYLTFLVLLNNSLI
jgi:hypothetical protein